MNPIRVEAVVLAHLLGGFVDHGNGYAMHDVSRLRLDGVGANAAGIDGPATRDVLLVFTGVARFGTGDVDERDLDLLRRPGTRVALWLLPAVARLDVITTAAIDGLEVFAVGDAVADADSKDVVDPADPARDEGGTP